MIRLAIALALAMLIAGVMACCIGCGPSRVQIEAATYQAEQIACVEKFKPDNLKVTECRDQVKAHYGRLDGGSNGDR